MRIQSARRPSGMGVLPLIWAVPAAVGAGVMWLGTCDKWYCTGNISRSIFTDPETPPATGPQSIPPSAPQSEGSMSIPGAWTVDDLMRQTAEAQNSFRTGATYAGATAKQASGGDPWSPTDDPKTDNTLLVAAAVAAGVLAIALVFKR